MDVREDETATTVSVLLDRVRTEIDILSGVLGEMQIGLTPLLDRMSPNDPATYRHAQCLDLVLQTLENLSNVLEGTARLPACDGSVDIDTIAGKVTLADVAARLKGVTPAAPDHGADLDLF